MAEYTEPIHNPIKDFGKYVDRRKDLHKHGLEYWVEKLKGGYDFVDSRGKKKTHKADIKSEHIDKIVETLSKYEAIGDKYAELKKEGRDSVGALKKTGHEGLFDYLKDVAEKFENYQLQAAPDADAFYSALVRIGASSRVDVASLWQDAKENTEEGKNARRVLIELVMGHAEQTLKSSLFDNATRDIDSLDLNQVNSYKMALAATAQYLSRGNYLPDLSRITTLEEANAHLMKLAEDYISNKDLPQNKDENESRRPHSRRKTGKLKASNDDEDTMSEAA